MIIMNDYSDIKLLDQVQEMTMMIDDNYDDKFQNKFVQESSDWPAWLLNHAAGNYWRVVGDES